MNNLLFLTVLALFAAGTVSASVDECRVGLELKKSNQVTETKFRTFKEELAKAFKKKPEFYLTEDQNTEFQLKLRLDTFWDHHSGDIMADVNLDVFKDGSNIFEKWILGPESEDDAGALSNRNIRSLVKDLFKESLKSCEFLRSQE
ncbi:MAG TPA: hypothetical protein VNJ01_11830 [Bacteriovoracaceae bacterium]|nr:hypothetical protein [Bacteriovoracaceae bacterium]